MILKLLVLLVGAMLSITAMAGYDEGFAAYKKQDYASAFAEWKELADQGNVRAQYALALLFQHGQGVSQDYVEAAKLFRLAAEQEDSRAQWELGYMYTFGQGVPKDYAQAVKWIRKSANQGYSEAQCYLGQVYLLGIVGEAQNSKESLFWYSKAAESGSAQAQSILAHAYRNGNVSMDLAVDYQQALYWYEKSAASNDPDYSIFSANDLGEMYEAGLGVKKDYKRAAQLYLKGAQVGHITAQENIARLYRDGKGVQKNLVLAYAWLDIAVSSKRSVAVREKFVAERDNLGRVMTPKNIERARELSIVWKPGMLLR